MINKKQNYQNNKTNSHTNQQMARSSPMLSFLLGAIFPLVLTPVMTAAIPSHVPQLSHVRPLLFHTRTSGPLHVPIHPAKLIKTYKCPRWRASSELPKKTMAEKVRADFLRVLCSRRSEEVPLRVEPAQPVKDPVYQDNGLFRDPTIMESAPKGNIENWKDLLVEENLYLYTEPTILHLLATIHVHYSAPAGHFSAAHYSVLATIHVHYSAPARPQFCPLLCAPLTGKCKEWVRPLLEAYASRGYVAISIDSRYHGERATSNSTYQDALVSSWKKGDTMPFIYDTTWDLIKLADYLTQRHDIDSKKIGITGESLGGMHAWFGAAADTRYTVVVPVIGIQGFRWAIENDKWQARVESLKPVFEAARIDMGKSSIDKEVVEKVWDRIAPGLASEFDAPYTVPIMAPRPFLALNGAEDPRCPVGGLELPRLRAEQAYEEAGHPDYFKVSLEPGIGHQVTTLMVKQACDWFDKFML